MKRVIHIAVSAVFAFLMLIAAALLLLRLFGITAYSVKTPSMYPSCPVGTMIFSAKTDFDDFSKGDIVTYKIGDSVITHRVYEVDKKARTITTKGDNNNVPDNVPVSEKNIVGRVEFYIPYAGYIFIFAETVYGKICIVAVFVLLAVLSVITKNTKDDDNGEESDSKKTDGEIDSDNPVDELN